MPSIKVLGNPVNSKSISNLALCGGCIKPEKFVDFSILKVFVKSNLNPENQIRRFYFYWFKKTFDTPPKEIRAEIFFSQIYD